MKRKDDEQPKVTLQITGKKEQVFNHVTWGPLNKSIYVATDLGRVLVFDLQGNQINEAHLHTGEIFQL